MRLSPTLPRSAYVDADVFAIERERLWAQQWCAVARESDVPRARDVLRVEIGGESVILVRGDDAIVRGFYNVCRHRGAQLIHPDAPACSHVMGAIRCPYHSWTYGLDGALHRAPFLGDVETGELGLHPVGVDEWGGFLWVHLSPESARPLREQLGAAPERVRRYPLAELDRGATIRYEVDANWKVLAENYNECYHCGPVHPELCDLVPEFRQGGQTLEWEDGIPHRDGAWTFTMSGTTNRSPFSGLSEAERTRHKGELLYPNLWLSLSAEHVAAFWIKPIAVDRTEVVMDLLFHPDAIAAADFDSSDVADFWHLVNLQDWSICESVQRGMSSRAFERGWFAPMEDDSAHIGRWYAQWMSDHA